MSDNKEDVSTSLISAVNEGNLESLKKLVSSHGVSQCKEWYGGYALLRDTIKSGHLEMAAVFLQEDTKAANKAGSANTSLHLAVKQEFYELVRNLLEENAPVDTPNDQNETPLHIAAKDGYRAGVRILLRYKASVTAQNKDGSTPLLLAIEGNHEEVVQELLKHASANLKDEINNAASTSPPGKRKSLLNRILLCSPCACDKVSKLVVRFVVNDEGHKKIVDDLSNYGFVLSREYVNEALLRAAIEKGHTKLVEDILTIATSPNDVKCRSVSFLQAAVEKGHTEIIKLDAKGYLSLLSTALRSGHKQIVRLLLNSSSGTNRKDEERNCAEEDKWLEVVQLLLARGADMKEVPELLHSAVEEGFVKVCKLLIENGADVNALNTHGKTPLYLSCEEESSWRKDEENRRRRDEIVKLLLNNGADANINIGKRLLYNEASNTMRTAFHYAAYYGRKEAVSIFLHFGVDVDIRAEDGSTPLHMACEGYHHEIVEILLKNNANVDARKVNGKTPLHVTFDTYCSYDQSYSGVVIALLENGCDFDAKVKYKTVLDNVLLRAKDRRIRDIREHGDVDHLYFPCQFMASETHDMVQILKEHAIKLEAAGLYVVGKAFGQFACRYCRLSNFRQKCQEELHRMKNEHLNPQCTLYDILIKSKNPTYARNKALMHTLNGFNVKKFPIYRGLILGCLRRSESRLVLLSSGQKALDILVKTSNKLNGNKCSILPAEVLEQIVSHLINGDVNNLIACGEALKRQLKRQ